ncbi:MAG: hypothetical protein OXC07_09940 [Kistimonas sp.]|nr:hypothetical protein [Kistimonas sp.]
MNPVNHSPSSSGSPPTTVQTERENLSADKATRSIPDATPLLAGTPLGTRLQMRGLKAVKMAFVHPKATFDLAFGRLATMRETNPAKYLEELNDLSTSSKNRQFVLQEGQLLKQNHSDLKRPIEEQQRTAAAVWLEHICEETSPEDLPDRLTAFSECTRDLNIPRVMVDRHSEFGASLLALSRQIARHTDDYSLDQFRSLQEAFHDIASIIEKGQSTDQTTLPRYLSKTLDRLDAQVYKMEEPIREIYMDATNVRIRNAASSELSEDDGATSPMHFTSDLSTIDEEISAESVEELLTTVRKDPDNEEAWSIYDEVADSLSKEEQRRFLTLALDNNPERTEASVRLELLDLVVQERPNP